MRIKILIVFLGFLFLDYTRKETLTITNDGEGKKNYSGIYPELTYYNNEGECGTGDRSSGTLGQ